MEEEKKEEEKFEAYNSDGDPIEGVLPPEEIKSLQEKLEETNAKLEKLENKDFNFKKFRDMTDAEKEKLSATEIELKRRSEELEEKQQQLSSTFVKDVKNDLLESLVGDDEELRKKVELNYARIKDSESAQSRAEIKQLLKDAYSMSVGVKTVNPLGTAVNKTGGVGKSADKKIDGDLADMSKKLGISEEDLEKYGKK